MQMLFREWFSSFWSLMEMSPFTGCMHDTVCGVALVWTLIFSADCGDNARTAAMLRTLPQDRLASLFADIEELDRARDRPTLEFNKQRGFPDFLDDLAPRGLRMTDGSTMLYMSGCMDDKVVLFFDGVNATGDETKAIRLLPGELMPTEVLWSDR